MSLPVGSRLTHFGIDELGYLELFPVAAATITKLTVLFDKEELVGFDSGTFEPFSELELNREKEC